jgi:type IV secretory pathway component VirB8
MSTSGRGMIYSIYNYVHQRERYDLLYLHRTIMSTSWRGMIYFIHNYVHQRERYDLLHPQLCPPEGEV